VTAHIVHLMGPAGTGKLTIARALAPMIGAIVVDNHWINNPVFGLLSNDRVTPFPEAVWDEIEKVRSAVLETIATISAVGQSFVLTNELYEDEIESRAIVHQVRGAAKRRGSIYVPVRLMCSAEELAKRVVSPERTTRLKSMDAKAARVNALRPVLTTGMSQELTLDTSSISAWPQRKRSQCTFAPSAPTHNG
jgi:predicted kinase